MSVNEKMTAIADAIRDKTKGTKPLTLDDMVTEIPKVFDAGKKAERDAFWEVFQKGGDVNGVIYQYAFAYNKFSDENYFPKYDIITSTGVTPAQQTFYLSANLSDIKVPFRVKGSRMNQTFASCSILKRIPLLDIGNNVTEFLNVFNYCQELEELNISGVIKCNGFNVRHSPKLNKASIESIINALSTTESGLTVTFSKTAVNNAFTAEEWDALEATKTNWTISLV